MTMLSSCPQCESKAVKKNGYTRHGKQNHRCLSCGKQFSLEPLKPSPEDEIFCATIDNESEEYCVTIGVNAKNNSGLLFCTVPKLHN